MTQGGSTWSIETLISYLQATPWTVDNFSVDTHLDYLKRLYATWNEKNFLEFGMRYLFMRVRKPQSH